MHITIKIGDKEVGAFCSAATPLIFRQIFKRDFLKEKSAMITRLSNLTRNSDKLMKIRARLVELSEIENRTQEETAEMVKISTAVSENLNADDYGVIDEQNELGAMLLFVMIKQDALPGLDSIMRLNNNDYIEFLNSYSYSDIITAGKEALKAWDADAHAQIERKNLQGRTPEN